MRGGGRSCEWMDLISGGSLGGGEVGLIGGGWVGMTFFSFFFVGLRWILWAVDDVVEVVGR